MNTLGQGTRLVVLAIYVVALLLVSEVATGDLIPDASSTSGLWLYGGLLALLLGDVVVTPYFAKPGDSLSYAVTALIPLLAADVVQNEDRVGFERILWGAAIVYALAVLSASFMAMVLRSGSSNW